MDKRLLEQQELFKNMILTQLKDNNKSEYSELKNKNLLSNFLEEKSKQMIENLKTILSETDSSDVQRFYEAVEIVIHNHIIEEDTSEIYNEDSDDSSVTSMNKIYNMGIKKFIRSLKYTGHTHTESTRCYIGDDGQHYNFVRKDGLFRNVASDVNSNKVPVEVLYLANNDNSFIAPVIIDGKFITAKDISKYEPYDIDFITPLAFVYYFLYIIPYIIYTYYTFTFYAEYMGRLTEIAYIISYAIIYHLVKPFALIIQDKAVLLTENIDSYINIKLTKYF